MYKIIKDGEMISYTVSPNYIKFNPETGVFISATKEEAEGVAVNGIPYQLFGKTLKNNQGEVLVNEVDSGELIFEILSATKENSNAIDKILLSILN